MAGDRKGEGRTNVRGKGWAYARAARAVERTVTRQNKITLIYKNSLRLTVSGWTGCCRRLKRWCCEAAGDFRLVRSAVSPSVSFVRPPVRRHRNVCPTSNSTDNNSRRHLRSDGGWQSHSDGGATLTAARSSFCRRRPVGGCR